MHDVLNALTESQLFYVTRLQLRVMPQYRSLALSGFIRLRTYEALDHPEKRFEGEESKQIKAALKKILPQNLLVEVKTSPDLQRFKGGAYEFSVTQTFATLEEKEAEIRLLRSQDIISEHVYPLARGWQEKISGSDAH